MPVTKQTKPARTESKVEFVGKAWINTSKASGKKYLNVVLDDGVQSISISSNERLELWSNTKREGRRDADYRLSIRTIA